MASQWRIRHKLMLGLVLVVGIMALLLGGTLRGLWSYYETINFIRCKQAELRVAEELKTAVGTLKRVAESPDALEIADPEPGSSGPPKTKLQVALDAAKERLDAYNKQLDETIHQGYDDPTKSQHALALVIRLNEDFVKLDGAVPALDEASANANVGTEVVQQQKLKRVREQERELDEISQDLHGLIYEEVSQRIDGAKRHYQVPLWIIIPAAVLGLLLVCGLMRAFYAWVFHPIRDLEAGVNRVAQGDFDHRIDVHSGDEMEDLGAAFNDMTERLQALYNDLARQVNERSRQLVRSERLASVGFLAAGVAHEINNPLASIAFCGEALEARLAGLLHLLPDAARDDGELEIFTRYLKMIQEEAFRCKTITEKLLDFSRGGERRRERTDLAALVQSVLDMAQHLPNSKGKHITFEAKLERVPGGRVTAPVNAEEIKSVVLNLVVNALDSMDDGGRLTIRLSRRDGLAELQFADTGCGMSQEVLENIFEPFFTRSRTGKGTGLGLTISHRIVSQHGGEIEAASPGPNLGSTFTVRLPVHPAEAAAPAEARGLAA